MSEALLEVRSLTVRFGGLVAIDALDLAVQPGQILALVGPNGAGKTTVLNCVSGFVQPTAGTIRFNGRDLLMSGRDQRARLGIGRTFQNLQLFASMTVVENLLVAQHSELRVGLFRGIFPAGLTQREDSQARIRALETLRFLG
ncbi:MAG TPA: ATP-binding cassette domain-containing protein, partial [Ktedonobacterales bacterium]|nr:ATP-binding cassette domain-containing protein [Ktedonobacterales bacterium]